MERSKALHQLKFLYDQVHQTAQRVEHLPERMPYHVHPESLNYEKDLVRIKGEYNRLAQSAQAEGVLTSADLEAEGLPPRFSPREQ